MRRLLRPTLPLAALALLAPAASSHFNILLPESPSARSGETVTFLYRFGHPFEHELFDAPPPARVFVVMPDGRKAELAKTLEKVKAPTPDKKEVTAYRFRFKAEQRGDYTFVLQTPPIWLEEDQEFIQDTVKVVLHVQAQKNWDADTGRQFKIVPLTRPYGLPAGVAFQAQVLVPPGPDVGGPDLLEKGKPLAGALVEVERFNQVRLAKLPPDEQRTRTAKTDPNGVVTATLTEPGWWALTARRDAGKRDHKGKPYPVRQRATLWVWVDGK